MRCYLLVHLLRNTSVWCPELCSSVDALLNLHCIYLKAERLCSHSTVYTRSLLSTRQLDQ